MIKAFIEEGIDKFSFGTILHILHFMEVDDLSMVWFHFGISNQVHKESECIHWCADSYRCMCAIQKKLIRLYKHPSRYTRLVHLK